MLLFNSLKVSLQQEIVEDIINALPNGEVLAFFQFGSICADAEIDVSKML